MLTREESLEYLIKRCSEKLKKIEKSEVNGNKAYSPVFFIYFETAKEGFGEISDVISNNWRFNAKYIFHIGISFEGNQLRLCDLRTNSVIDGLEENKSFALDELFVQALSIPNGVFADHTNVKIKLILNCSEEAFDEYLELSMKFKTNLPGINVYKDLYVLLQQLGNNNERIKVQSIIKKFYSDEKTLKENFKQIFLLSDRMKNGKGLEQFEKKSNYRLIADSVLFIDNDGENYPGRKARFYADGNKYKTISQRIVQKPCREIAAVMLLTIVKNILSVEQIDLQEIKQKFEDDTFIESYFEENFISGFPKAIDFKFLPYTKDSFKKLNLIYKNQNKNQPCSLDEKVVDEATLGCFSAFYKENYVNVIQKNFSREDFKGELCAQYRSSYTYKDIKESFRDDIVSPACEGKEKPFEGKRKASLFESIRIYCDDRSQKDFHCYIKDTYLEFINEMRKEAQEYESILEDIQIDLMSIGVVKDKGLYKGIEGYYSEYVSDYMKANRNGLKKLFYPNDISFNAIIENLERVFSEIISRDYDNKLCNNFSDELSIRLGESGTPEMQNKLIEDALIQKIDEHTRLHVATDNFKQISDIYFCADDSPFYKTLVPTREADDVNLFNTSDLNCFEHVKIYGFDEIRDIYGKDTEG